MMVTRVVAPSGAFGFAILAEAKGWGLFNYSAWPAWLEVVVAFVVLDLAIYLQHRIFHFVPVLWRLHRMHHADLDVDVTTGARFHPIEILLSLGIKFVVIVALGASPLAVMLFEIGLNATSMFNHSNVAMPAALDRVKAYYYGMISENDKYIGTILDELERSGLRRSAGQYCGFAIPMHIRLQQRYRGQL